MANWGSSRAGGSGGGGIVHGVVTEYSQKRFPTLNGKDLSNKYWTMDRVSKDGNEIVVHVADEHVVPTKYGAALILDADNVVFIKNWQYDKNYYGTEVRLNKQYWKVSKWGDHSDLFGTGDGKTTNLRIGLKSQKHRQKPIITSIGKRPLRNKWCKVLKRQRKTRRGTKLNDFLRITMPNLRLSYQP